MGLDATLSRIDGRPLGRREDLVGIFEQYFPGIEFGWTPSGRERLAIAQSRGVEYPPTLREHFEKQPAVFEGVWDGPDGWMRLRWDVEGDGEIGLEFVGEWSRSDRVWAEVLPRYGWQIEYHSSLIAAEQAIRRN